MKNWLKEKLGPWLQRDWIWLLSLLAVMIVLALTARWALDGRFIDKEWGELRVRLALFQSIVGVLALVGVAVAVYQLRAMRSVAELYLEFRPMERSPNPEVKDSQVTHSLYEFGLRNSGNVTGSDYMIRLWIPPAYKDDFGRALLGWTLGEHGVSSMTLARVTGEWLTGWDTVRRQYLLTVRSQSHDRAYPDDFLALGILEVRCQDDSRKSVDFEYLIVGDRTKRRKRHVVVSTQPTQSSNT